MIMNMYETIWNISRDLQFAKDMQLTVVPEKVYLWLYDRQCMYCACFSHHITSLCTLNLLFLQVLWCLWIKAVPFFLTTEDLPFESYSGSKAEEHLAHFLRKPTLSKCSYNGHLDWALRFGAWEEFKVIKNTYHWKHLYFTPLAFIMYL